MNWIRQLLNKLRVQENFSGFMASLAIGIILVGVLILEGLEVPEFWIGAFGTMVLGGMGVIIGLEFLLRKEFKFFWRCVHGWPAVIYGITVILMSLVICVSTFLGIVLPWIRGK